MYLLYNLSRCLFDVLSWRQALLVAISRSDVKSGCLCKGIRVRISEAMDEVSEVTN